jgi:dihydroorotate dehydrogenase
LHYFLTVPFLSQGGRIILDHVARRMKMPPEWREPMTMIEVDQVLDIATRIKKISPHPEGITVTVQNPNMPGKPQIVIDSETGTRVITVIKNKVKNK